VGFQVRLWCKLCRRIDDSPKKFSDDHAARTAAQISGVVAGLPDNFPILN